MSHSEAEYVFTHRVFPRKYIGLYKSTQKLIRERFIGIPDSPVAWLLRRFNYIKYYLKCLFTSI